MPCVKVIPVADFESVLEEVNTYCLPGSSNFFPFIFCRDIRLFLFFITKKNLKLKLGKTDVFLSQFLKKDFETVGSWLVTTQ